MESGVGKRVQLHLRNTRREHSVNVLDVGGILMSDDYYEFIKADHIGHIVFADKNGHIVCLTCKDQEEE